MSDYGWGPVMTVKLPNPTHARSGEPLEDQFGNRWIEFEVDYLAQQDVGKCAECGAEIKTGWLCLDGGDEICESHVEYR